MCTYTNYAKQRSKVSILNIRQVVGLGIESKGEYIKYRQVLGAYNYNLSHQEEFTWFCFFR